MRLYIDGISRRTGFIRCGALIFFLACVLLAGCSAKSHKPVTSNVERPGIYDPAMLTHIRDFDRFPQDLNVYAQNAPKQDLREEQAQAAARFRGLFFSPWTRTSSSVPIKDAAWAERTYASRTGYTADGGVIPMQERNAVSDNAQYYLYPSLAAPGIITDNALMRGMPTTKPFYDDPAKPGQGFPFDHYQMTALWTGTPVFVSHISRDKRWLFCETAMCSGWVDAAKVARVDAAFMEAWRAAPLYAVTRDRMNAGSGAELRIGTLLPAQDQQLLLPKRAASGQAAVTRLPLGAGLEPFPMPFSPKAVASLGNQFMDRPYGWGGAFFERDCSLMLQDLFTPFGVWLPRNSSGQIKNGGVINLSGLSPGAKAAKLASAEPFRTLVGMPGHVTLYVGQYKGQGVLFHSIWGLRIMTAQGEGRAVLGKACVTSLTPGQELHNIITEKMLLYRFTSAATVLVGGGR